MNGLTLSASSDDARRRLIAVAAMCGVLAFALLPYLLFQKAGQYKTLYPMIATGVAVALYVYDRPTYFAYVLWVWFLSPFVRRIVDWQVGWYAENSMVLTAPYLVAGVGFLGLWMAISEEERGVRQIFWLTVGVLLYGGLVGAVSNGLMPVAKDTLDWTIPPLIGALLLVDWRNYPRYRDLTLRTFTIGMAVLGLYGVYQFFFLPEWDKMWMEGAAITSIGQPYPLRVRVFGPMNAPQPYAATIMVGLLGLFAMSGQGAMWTLAARLAAIPAAVGFLLSQSRTQWGGLVVGILFILIKMKARSRRAVMFYLALAAVVAAPIAFSSNVVMVIGDEFASFTSLSSDGSFNERVMLYEALPSMFVRAPQGGGLGSTGRAARTSGNKTTTDSGIIAAIMTFGFVSVFYFLALALLFLWVWRR